MILFPRPAAVPLGLELTVTWFGAGRAPGAPGTWGSLAALPFAWVITGLGGAPALIAAALVVFAVGVYTSGLYARLLGIADPSRVVIDEVVGQWLTLLVVPRDPVAYLLAFILFRVADVTKPWPIGWVDRRVSGGLGIMLDDVLAAVLAGGGLYLIQRWVVL